MRQRRLIAAWYRWSTDTADFVISAKLLEQTNYNKRGITYEAAIPLASLSLSLGLLFLYGRKMYFKKLSAFQTVLNKILKQINATVQHWFTLNFV